MASKVTCIEAVVKKVIRKRTEKGFESLKIAIRGGRHSYIGASTVSKGVVVDVSGFNYTTQTSNKSLIRVGAGITLGNLYDKLWQSRMLYPGGSCPTVGLSGLTLGGGQGVVGRKYGLSADQVVEIRMVNSNGTDMIIDSERYPDLFWALRGGGNGNFGIVYEFTLWQYPIPEVNVDNLAYYYNPSEWHTVIRNWLDCITSDKFKNNDNVWSKLTVTPNEVFIGTHFAGTKQEYDNSVECLVEIPLGTTPAGYFPNTPAIHCTYTPDNYSGSIAFWADCVPTNQKCGTVENFKECDKQPTVCGGQPFSMNSAYQTDKLSDAGIQTIIDYMRNVENATHCTGASIMLDSLGGKINKVSSNSTAFPHRGSIVTYQFLSYFLKPCNQTAMEEWLYDFHRDMTKYTGPAAYRNYANLKLEDFNERYFLHNLKGLMSIKTKYDPDNIFNYSQSIEPAEQVTTPALPSRYLPYAIVGVLILVLGWALGRFTIFGHSADNRTHQD